MSDVRPIKSPPVYNTCRWSARMLFRLFYRIRILGEDRVPRSGPVLLVANHGSFFDPPIIGATLQARDTNFLARRSLFKGPLGWLIRRCNSIPLDDEAGDIKAIKQVLERLGEGEPVLIFPEGSRTYDGKLQPFRDGVRLIARRGKCPVVPIAIEGAFESWPRTRPLPTPFGCRLAVEYGEPIPADQLTGDDGNERLERIIDRMRLELRERMRAGTGGRFPPAGPADEPLHADDQSVG
ncbi:MAG: lysophospholipid acyltransferase family protein [Planctomycetota bacterium]